MGRKRNHRIDFWASPEEVEQIEQRMEQIGTGNMSAYLRKQAIDGYIIKLDLPELREMVSLLRRSSANLNQIAKRVNAAGRIYREDMEDLLQKQEQLWKVANQVLTRLASLK